MAGTPDKPGWYRHPDMVDTLCYWDGFAWTDNVQPAGDDLAGAVSEDRKKIVGALIAIAIIVVFVYFVVAAG